MGFLLNVAEWLKTVIHQFWLFICGGGAIFLISCSNYCFRHGFVFPFFVSFLSDLSMAFCLSPPSPRDSFTCGLFDAGDIAGGFFSNAVSSGRGFLSVLLRPICLAVSNMPVGCQKGFPHQFCLLCPSTGCIISETVGESVAAGWFSSMADLDALPYGRHRFDFISLLAIWCPRYYGVPYFKSRVRLACIFSSVFRNFRRFSVQSRMYCRTTACPDRRVMTRSAYYPDVFCIVIILCAGPSPSKELPSRTDFVRRLEWNFFHLKSPCLVSEDSSPPAEFHTY